MSQTKQKHFFLMFFITLITLLVSATNILTPLDGDPKVLFAFANQTNFLGSFPYNLSQAWVLKPFGTKLLIYLFYKVACIFSDFSNKLNFEVTLKSIYLACILLVSFASPILYDHSLFRSKFKYFCISIILYLSLISLHALASFQPEDISIVMLILISSLLLSRNKISKWALPVAAFLSVFLIGIKGITGLLLIPTWTLFAFQNYNKKIFKIFLTYISWLFLFSTLTFLLLYFKFPIELQDIKDATVLQSSFSMPLLSRLNFLFFGFVGYSSLYPVTQAGTISACLIIPYFLNRKKYQQLTFLLLSYLVSFGMVFIQGKFFRNHFSITVFPSIIALLFFTIQYSNVYENLFEIKRIYKIILFLILLIFGLILKSKFILLASLLSIFPLLNFKNSFDTRAKIIFKNFLIFSVFFYWGMSWFRFISPFSENTNAMNSIISVSANERLVFNEWNIKYRLHEPIEILHLNDGMAAYYINLKSYLRYFFPLPLQRIVNNVPLQTSKLYLDTYQKLLNFSGQFILLQPRWFNVSKLYPEFYKIIEQNYKIVEEVNINNTVYLLYQRN